MIQFSYIKNVRDVMYSISGIYIWNRILLHSIHSIYHTCVNVYMQNIYTSAVCVRALDFPQFATK